MVPNGLASGDADVTFCELIKNFADDHPSFHVPKLNLSFGDNFKQIQNLADIKNQNNFFDSYKSHLEKIGSAAKLVGDFS
jgi:hypothetical protein